jgi:hypothetical protein
MVDNLPNEWGLLDSETEVTDTHTRGVYRAHNQDGRVILIDRTTGYRMSFDAHTRIDHDRFEINRSKKP